jgi:hypothetical protein
LLYCFVAFIVQMEEAFGLAALAKNLRKDSTLERSGFRTSWV